MGIRRADAVFIAGVALPQRAQQRRAERVSTSGFLKNVSAPEDFVPISFGSDYICYVRRGQKEQCLIAVNRSGVQNCIEIEPGWEDAAVVFGYKPDKNTLKIDGLGFAVLRK